jgi:large subunit ribosomal protein L28
MSKKCQVTGAQPGYGHNVSHSNQRTNRRWEPNLQNRRFWLPSEGRYVSLRLTTKAIKTVDKQGIESVVARLRASGVKV